jgi:hypothetical protein
MKKRIYLPPIDIRRLYDRFNASVVDKDCGTMCAPHNPNGQPFCCDICHAVPAAYRQEWDYLQNASAMWHLWRGDECPGDSTDPEDLRQQMSEHMLLLACKGAAHCRREFRALSCRQFPFFPYVSSDYRFLGMTYEWVFEKSCWVISNLSQVNAQYRKEFIETYDALFALWQEEFDSYAIHSEEMREAFSAQNRRIPLLHRNGKYYLLSPKSEKLQRIDPEHFPRHGFYKNQGR